MADTDAVVAAQADPIASEAAAAEPLVEQPEATPAAAGPVGDAAAEQTAVLPVVVGGPSASETPAQAAAGEADPAQGSKQKDAPVKIGFKVFQGAEAALRYFFDLLKCLRREQDINEYEFKMVYDLLERGHPAAAQKIGCGVAAFQIMRHADVEDHSDCFYVVRTDGSREDFSIKKSVAGLFPVWAKSVEGRQPAQTSRGRGRGRGAGRGGGRDGGRGGRGRGGRGFRARGRGRRGRGRG